MHELFIAGLNRALKEDPPALHAFGLARTLRAPDGAEDRLELDGQGFLTRTLTRAAGDQGGLPIGVFRAAVVQDEVAEVARLVRELARLPARPSARGAQGGRVQLEGIAGGELFAEEASAAPGAAPYLEPLLRKLAALQGRASQQALRTLAISLELSSGPRGQPARALLRLRNDGAEGTWVANPAAPGAAARALLIFASKSAGAPAEEDLAGGAAPVPPAPARVELALSGASDKDAPPAYVWLGAGQKVALQLAAVDALPKGALTARAQLELAGPEPTLAGRPLLRGLAVSTDVALEVQ